MDKNFEFTIENLNEFKKISEFDALEYLKFRLRKALLIPNRRNNKMSVDISIVVETLENDVWTLFELEEDETPFNYRSYDTFAFLAGIKNEHDIVPISECRGLPEKSYFSPIEIEGPYGTETYGDNNIASSWLLVSELLAFDYNKRISDKRLETYREFLGEGFFHCLKILESISLNPEHVRIVFVFN